MSPDEPASLEETLDLLSDPEAMALLREAQAAVEAGDRVTGDELRLIEQDEVGRLVTGLSGISAHVERRTGRSTHGRILTMRVTEKGQVTIPKELRDALGIGAGTDVEFERRKDALVIRKARVSSGRGTRLAERLRGRGDVEMTTDQIMALTRAD
jgi:AbrB family looped-hinge helix DNA binding protein